MTLNNLENASNIKTLIGSCYPQELVTISEVDSGNIKKLTYSEYIKEIKYSGGTATKKTAKNQLATNHDYYHDRDGKVLYYYHSDASVQAVINFGFFFKTGDTEPLHVDINDKATDLVIYEGRMNESTFIESIEDISNGTMAVSSNSISFVNNDGYYQKLCRDTVSFKNCRIDIIISYNDLSNNTFMFKGFIESVSFRSKEVIFECKDAGKLLETTAKMTDVESEYITDKTTYPHIKDDDVNKEIPYMLGRAPSLSIEKTVVARQLFPHIYGEETRIAEALDSWDQAKEQHQIIPFIQQNKNTTIYDQYGTVNLSVNTRSRKYVAFRMINNPIVTNRIMLVDSMVTDLNSYATTNDWYGFEVEIPVADCKNYFVGQQCFWYSWLMFGASAETWSEEWGRQAGWHRVSYVNFETGKIRIAPSFQEHLYKVGSTPNRSYIWFSPHVVAYEESNKIVQIIPAVSPYEIVNISNGKMMNIEVARCAVDNGYSGYYYPNSDNTKILLGGANVVKNEGTNAVNDQWTELDDFNFSVRFVTSTENLSLGAILHRVLRQIGYVTDGGNDLILAGGTNSFRDLDTKLGETYWTLHTGMCDTYQELLQMMLSSIFGFMYPNNDGKMGVRLFEKTPYNSQLWNLNEDDVVMDSIMADFNGSGIYTRLRATGDINETFISEQKDTYKMLLHGDLLMENKYHFESKSIYETKVMPRKFAYLSNPVRKFEFTIINRGYDILMGDRINMEFTQSNMWLGEPKVYELFVIGLNRSLQGVTVTAVENIFPSL